MDFDPFLTWVEDGWLSLLLRESDYGFSGSLVFHIVGSGLVAAPTIGISLALLGLLPGVPLAAMKRFLPIFWLGLLVSVPSGVLLVIAYPTKILTNPIFYLKIAAILAGLWTVTAMRRSLAGVREARLGHRSIAIMSLGLWAFVIAAGRLLAYTYTRLMVGF